MPALNYKPEIAAAYESGAKLHTIRTRRKDNRNPRPGQTLFQYTGQRTKKCRKLGEDVCQRVRDIQIWFPRSGSLVCMELDGQRLSMAECAELAVNDGFENLQAMCDWFRDAYQVNNVDLWPLDALLIQWRETTY